VTAIWKWFAALLAGAVAVLGGLAWWRSRKPAAPTVTAADVKRAHELAIARTKEAEKAASAVIAAVDLEAAKAVEEASHGGAAALRDSIAGRR
jgi:hypothetical protein